MTLAVNSSTQATVVVGTTKNAANSRPAHFPLSGYAGGLSLAGLLFCFSRRRPKRIFPTMLALLLLLFATAALPGCGGDGVNTASKGTYTITLTATPSSSTAAVQTATVSVTVQ